MRKRNFTLEWQMDVPSLWVTGDRVLLLFLLENLIDEAVRYEVSGILRLVAKAENGFVRVDFIDMRRTYSQEELNALFYPDRERMCPRVTDNGWRAQSTWCASRLSVTMTSMAGEEAAVSMPILGREKEERDSVCGLPCRLDKRNNELE